MDYEFEVLVNRYLYYVQSEPLISDFEYDALEREARSVLPETSVVHGVGSSLSSSYPDKVLYEAMRRLQT
jgi:NAD-dependent DNA ligase